MNSKDFFENKNGCGPECIKFHEDLNAIIRADGFDPGDRTNEFNHECAQCKKLFCGYHVTSRHLRSWQEDILGSKNIGKYFKFSASRCRQCMDLPGNFFEKTDLKSRWEKFIYPYVLKFKSWRMKNRYSISDVNIDDKLNN